MALVHARMRLTGRAIISKEECGIPSKCAGSFFFLETRFDWYIFYVDIYIECATMRVEYYRKVPAPFC